MNDSDYEIVKNPAAVSRIFELMLERRKPLSIVQHGRRSDAWVVKVQPDSLILAKRDKASIFTAADIEFQFRCILGRNITGKSRVLRLNEEYLELTLPPQVTIIQRRHAYRVVPTADSVAFFLTGGKWLTSGRIEDISSRGVLIMVPQATPISVPGEIKSLSLQLNHLIPPNELAHKSKATHMSLEVKIPEATVVRKADKGLTRFAAYGLYFVPSANLERELVQMILRFERAVRHR